MLVFDIDDHGVTLVEGTATGVLSRQADWNATFHQAGKSQGFGHAIVNGAFSRTHFGALLQELLHLRVDVEPFGISSQAIGELGQLFA